MSNRNAILSACEKRTAILDELLDLFPMIPGAFKEVFRKCGKTNCWCAQHARGHSLRRITWTENGRSHSKAVGSDDIDWYIIATDNYRKFQSLLRDLRSADEMLNELLQKYSVSQVTSSRIAGDAASRNAKT